ncbi:gluconate 5-dehydrogenase [Pusillimonas sp. T2]|uniref:SDR family oxidoreductase n=1 Tax=Pusillimonas sp. T2 TaxID=1548123 RepID=UPI000B9CD800|nr:SDR family oxidoreductase [Pusillimonas sp. T2]OXR49362.1 gluconate 5-dehydrogenase [Pusillimonas sp. T2]
MHAPDFSLNNKLALVTGSTQGLGYAIACAYAASGATVIINGRDIARVEAAVARIRSAGFQAQGWVQDIADLQGQRQAYEQLQVQVGTPDILVNNVGIRIRKSLGASTLDDIAQMMQVNLVAAIHLSKLAAAGMMAKPAQGGRIITLTSIAGPLARPGDAIYPIAKLGLQGMVHSLAVEYGPYGVTSNGIAPGTFATESNRELAADPVRGPVVVGRNPLGRWAQPGEIAGAAVFLASPSASYVNGHVLVVDGGFSVTF